MAKEETITKEKIAILIISTILISVFVTLIVWDAIFYPGITLSNEPKRINVESKGGGGGVGIGLIRRNDTFNETNETVPG